MEAKHTPGPWKVVRDRGGHWGMVDVEGPGVGGRMVVGFLSASNADYHQGVRIVADANLIAAAPDLLKAAKRALSVLKATGESVRPGNALGALQDAIAKAEAQS